MKKLLPITLLTLTTLFSSCLKEVIGHNAEKAEDVQNAVITPSDSYQPLTKGDTWVYNLSLFGSIPQQETLTITGDTKTFNGNTYYTAVETDVDTTITGYLSHTGSRYTTRTDDLVPDEVQDETYLDESLSVNNTYTVKANDKGLSYGNQIQFVGTVIEKGATLVVNGKTYKNVIHTHVEFQNNLGTGYQTVESHEWYVAKGIGVIREDIISAGVLIGQQTLLSYSLK